MPSKECLEKFFERKGWKYEVKECKRYGNKYCNCVVNGEKYYTYDMPRDDIDFVAVVEELGNESGVENGRQSSILKIVEIPDDVEWRVVSCECDTAEYIEEKHRVWS